MINRDDLDKAIAELIESGSRTSAALKDILNRGLPPHPSQRTLARELAVGQIDAEIARLRQIDSEHCFNERARAKCLVALSDAREHAQVAFVPPPMARPGL